MIGPSPNQPSTTFTNPGGAFSLGCLYISPQMTAAPTKEMAPGRKIKALASDSARILSTTLA